MALTDCIGEIVDLLVKRTPSIAGRRIIAVDGRSGSGKTTLSRQLAHEFGATLIQMDRIYPGWQGLAQGPFRLVENVLTPLSVGERPILPIWDWSMNQEGEWEPLEIAADVIIEGVGSATKLVRPFLSGIIWVQATEPLRYERAIGRDGELFAPYWDMWAAQECSLFEHDRVVEHAHIIIDVDGDFVNMGAL